MWKMIPFSWAARADQKIIDWWMRQSSIFLGSSITLYYKPIANTNVD